MPFTGYGEWLVKYIYFMRKKFSARMKDQNNAENILNYCFLIYENTEYI